jgi:tetratricopeptide (TPR) repeat protein
MRLRLPPLAALALALAVAGCASLGRTGDRAFKAGDYAAAAAAYERALQHDPAAHGDARLLLHLGLAYGLPGSPVHDAAKALAVLRDVATRLPDTRAGSDAALLVPQVEEEVRLTEVVAAARARISELEGDLSKAHLQNGALDAEVKARNEQIARLRGSLADVASQLKRVRDELEQLKRIDLQRGP